jgi:hypothetical protein
VVQVKLHKIQRFLSDFFFLIKVRPQTTVKGHGSKTPHFSEQLAWGIPPAAPLQGLYFTL